MMAFCNKCGAENPDDAAFCYKCGSTLYKEYDDCNLKQDEVQNTNSTIEKIGDYDRIVDGDKVTITRTVSKEDCEKYRIPMIICGFALGLFIIIAICTMEFEYSVYGHETGLQIGTERVTMLDMVTNGWSNTITMIFVLVILFALLSFVHFIFGGLSAIIMTFSFIPTVKVYDVGSGILSYDMYLRAPDFIDLLLTPTMTILIVGLIILGISTVLMSKFIKQYGDKVGLIRVIKETWISK